MNNLRYFGFEPHENVQSSMLLLLVESMKQVFEYRLMGHFGWA